MIETKTFNGEQEILKAIQNKRITGIVSVPFKDVLWDTIDVFNEFATNQLVGSNYGHTLKNIQYRVVGCDIKKQRLFIEINASAEDLIFELVDMEEGEK